MVEKGQLEQNGLPKQPCIRFTPTNMSRDKWWNVRNLFSSSEIAKTHVSVLLLSMLLSYLIGRETHRMRSGRYAQASSVQKGAHIIIEPLWSTPLARTHLRTHPHVKNLSAFNKNLTDAILIDHEAFVKQQRERENDIDGTALNDNFFEHQCGQDNMDAQERNATAKRVKRLGYRRSKQFRILASAAAELASRVIGRCGSETKYSARRKRLMAWATVHRSGSRHPLHVHEGATLSIVYYAMMGNNVGVLRLFDPRGPRPPFQGTIEIEAKEGEMVAFPGWLAHEVESGGSDLRVSLVFNVRGDWHGTEDLEVGAVQVGRWSGQQCGEIQDKSGEGGRGWRLDWGGLISC